MKKLLKWVGIIFIVIIVIGVIAGKDDKKSADTNGDEQQSAAAPTEQKQSSSNNKKTPSASLSDNEKIALNTLIIDDIKVNFDGRSSLFDYGYIPVTAKEMFKVYSANEARGDKTYKGKKLVISGVVDNISSSLGDIPVVSLKTGEMYNDVNVHFARKYRDTAVELNKNQKVSFACVGGSVVVGTPSVRDCQPVDVIAGELAKDKAKDIVNIVDNNKGDSNQAELAIFLFIKVIGKETNDFSACKPTDDNCIGKKIDSLVGSGEVGKKAIAEMAKELGIEIPSANGKK